MSIAQLGSQTASALQSLGLMSKPAAPPDQAPPVTPTEWDTHYGNMGTALLNVPFGEMIKSLGTSIANTQFELDMVSARSAQIMAGMPVLADGEAFLVEFGGEKDLTLFDLGFTPHFYQFTEAVLEVKMTMSFASEVENKASHSATDISGGLSTPFTFPVSQYWALLAGTDTYSAHASVAVANASTSAKYNMQAEGMSSLRTRMVPVPPPAPLEARMQALAAKRASLRQLIVSLDDNKVPYKNALDQLADQVKTETAPA